MSFNAEIGHLSHIQAVDVAIGCDCFSHLVFCIQSTLIHGSGHNATPVCNQNVGDDFGVFDLLPHNQIPTGKPKIPSAEGDSTELAPGDRMALRPKVPSLDWTSTYVVQQAGRNRGDRSCVDLNDDDESFSRFFQQAQKTLLRTPGGLVR